MAREQSDGLLVLVLALPRKPPLPARRRFEPAAADGIGSLAPAGATKITMALSAGIAEPVGLTLDVVAEPMGTETLLPVGIVVKLMGTESPLLVGTIPAPVAELVAAEPSLPVELPVGPRPLGVKLLLPA
jgi:hypothetical protein